ncbi:AAA family ATPase [Candidatus Poribacteria bacterium]
MAYTIAVAGKGGTGKTAVSSLIVAQLIKDGKSPVLAIDADPNSNLNERLGVELIQTLGDLEAKVLGSGKDVPVGMDKHRYVEYQLQTCLMEETGFDLLAMGRTEGPGCYCSVNNILRDFIDNLTPNYKYVVMDNEAGMEHLSRRTTRDVNLLLMVSDATLVGVRAAGRIHEMEQGLEIDVAESYLVVNRANGDLHESVAAEIEKTGLKLLGTVPIDENIAEYSIDSKSFLLLPDDSPARVAVRKLLDAVAI